MSKTRTAALCGLVTLVGAIATACGGTGSAASGGTPQMVSVSLKEFAIVPTTILAAAGRPIMVHVSDVGQAQHSFAVSAGGHTYSTPMIDPGGTAALSLPALKTGTYSAWCTVPGHKQSGMTALLQVGGRGGDTSGGGGDTMGGGSDMSTMTPEQMAEAHKRSTVAFPAKTEGLGGQVLKPSMDGATKVFGLVAKQVKWEVSPGEVKDAFTFNGTVPGPEIQVHQADKIRIVLQNELPQPTVIHFHGMTVPNAMDGVPYITQDPVMPGGYFVYEFTVSDPPGTYMYHSHFNSTEQVSRGLYGALVILPKGRPTWDEDYTEILGDGPLGYTINGKSFPATAPLVAKLGDTVHIRLSNMGQLIHPFHLHGYHFTVLEQDGQPVGYRQVVDTLMVAPGQTFDVQVYAIYPGAWAFHCHILSHVEGPEGMFGMVTALIVK